MRIFFTTPYSGKQYYQPYIDIVHDTLRQSKAIIISPEETDDYSKVLHEYESGGMRPTRAHYQFITNGIAEADIVVIEASHQSLRVGHEITLALIYGKPTLVVSQNQNYADHISHDLLTGKQYSSKRELRNIVKTFITTATAHLAPHTNQSAQSLESAVDSLRLTTFATMRQHALQDDGEFGELADMTEHDPDKAIARVQRQLGDLPIERPWSVYSLIYNEDVPDFIFIGLLQFILNIFNKHGIKKSDHIVDAFTHGGSIARHLSRAEYAHITAYSSSREMLAQTYRLCADNPEIKILESTPETLALAEPARAIVWIDYTTNLTLTEKELERQLQTQIDNLMPGGCFIFDIRTITGWQAYFFRDNIATYATPNFQRISIKLQDTENKLMRFDRFIRLKQNSGLWGEWRREQMVDRMWSLDEVRAIIARLKHCKLEAMYDDTFSPLDDTHEPSLAYIILTKH